MRAFIGNILRGALIGVSTPIESSCCGAIMKAISAGVLIGMGAKDNWSGIGEGCYSLLLSLKQHSLIVVVVHAVLEIQFLLVLLIFPRRAFIARSVEVNDIS